MARKGGNPELKKHHFKKGFDPNRNLHGAPKKLPRLKALMEALLGGEENGDPAKTPIAEIVTALVTETKNQKLGAQRVQAAKELLERAYGKMGTAESDDATAPITWNETKTYEGEKPKDIKSKKK